MDTFATAGLGTPDDKRRTTVAKALENFGTRVQYSVFECLLTATQLTEVRTRLTAIISLADDSVRFYFLPADAVPKIAILGRGTVTEDRASIWR